MLDSNQKLIAQSYFDLPKRTIRNSNIIILFQQTLKDVEHIYRDIAGFDMMNSKVCAERHGKKNTTIY